MNRSKAELRQRARAMPLPSPSEAERVRAHLARWLEDALVDTVLVYLPTADEIDLVPLVDAFPRFRWVVTRTPKSGWLTVHRLPARLEAHRFGFLQPAPTSPEVDPNEIDLALLPGLAFDVRGVRLGHGSGYFDQLLGRCRSDATLVGVTLERFVMADVPRMEHDIAVDRLATETGVRPVDSRA